MLISIYSKSETTPEPSSQPPLINLLCGSADTFHDSFSDQVTIGEGVSADCLAAGSNTAASTVAGGAAGNTGASSSA